MVFASPPPLSLFLSPSLFPLLACTHPLSSSPHLLVVLASTDDVVHPLLFACETKNPVIVKIALSSLQKLIQYNVIPQVRTCRCTVYVHVCALVHAVYMYIVCIYTIIPTEKC